MPHLILRSSVFYGLLLLIQLSCQEKTAHRQVPIMDKDFNQNWLFIRGNVSGGEKMEMDDANWRPLDLPHDWAIEGPFDSTYNARTGGLPVHGTAWYRKHFTVDPAQKGQQVAVAFDGAMSNAQVWLNGQWVGERPYGYIGFELDLTPHVRFGEDNVLAVRLSPEDLASRWYSGAGIYRKVQLKINDPIHIPQWGTYITTPQISDESAQVTIRTKVVNQGAQASNVTLRTVIKDKKGIVVAEADAPVDIVQDSMATVTQVLTIKSPRRWSLTDPYRYTAESVIEQKNTALDTYSTDFGIRTIEFDADKGFFLNGESVRFNGVCLHHDQGPLGAAVSYRAKERQMQIMKEMGVNALRTSHNPPSTELLEICDKMGIVVIVEAFDEWKKGKVINGYNKYFDQWHEKDLRDMIKRDRNHPSVIMWSIGNEILEQGLEDGWKLAKHLNDICHDEDPTRPTTAGFNYYEASFKNKLVYQVDIVGLNYRPYGYAESKAANPDMILYGSETSSQTSTRGEYHFPLQPEHHKETKQVSSYDVTVGPPWAYPPDVEFDAQERDTFVLGEFMWTGFDYLGEPTPYGGRDNSTNGYWNDDWPSRSSYFAPVDLCGFPKDRYYLYQAQWTTAPMVHVLPHWNWEGKEGEAIPVVAYSNCDEVELFVNGKSYGKKIKGKDATEIFVSLHGYDEDTYLSRHRLSWEVPYAPGSLKVIGYRDGKAVSEKEIKTAKAPAKINLSADREELQADGYDLSFVTVRIEDAEGNLCPEARNTVHFEVSGAGTLAAVGNGDPTSMDPFQEPQRKAFHGLCLLVVRTMDKEGDITIKASSEGLSSQSITLSVNKPIENAKN